MKENWNKKYGQWALVTGAAQGIGKEFSRQCAERGLSLVLVDRNAAELANTTDELTQEVPVEERSVELDLSADNFLEVLRRQTDDLEIWRSAC